MLATAALPLAAVRAVNTPPVVSSLSVARQDPVTLRVFVSSFDPDGDAKDVVVNALDSLGRPLNPAVQSIIPLGPMADGETSLSGVSIAVPWTVGDQVGVSVRDSAASSAQQRQWVPSYGGGTAPSLTWAGRYRYGPDSLTLVLSGKDSDVPNNTIGFLVRLQTDAGVLVAKRYVEGPGAQGRATWETRIALLNLGISRKGVVSAIDANGNLSAEMPFTVPAYGVGTAPNLKSVSVRRPLSYRVLVSFDGTDSDADQAVGTIEYMNGSDGTGTVVSRYEADFTRTSTGQPDFSGYSQVDGLSTARSVRVMMRDVAGNCSATLVAPVPPPFAPGDVDLDGRVTVRDALSAAQMLAGAPPPDPDAPARADVHPFNGSTYGGDGLTIQDVGSLLRIAGGLWKGPPKPT